MSPRKINQVTVLLLVIGFGSALVIYLTTQAADADPLLNDPLATKKYLRELQRIGGTANVVAAEFQDWFAGLWHGEKLAETVAILTVGVTLVFRFLAKHAHTFPDDASEGRAPPSGPA